MLLTFNAKSPEIEDVLDRVRARFDKSDRTFDDAWIEGLSIRSDVPEPFTKSGGICLAPPEAKLPYLDFDTSNIAALSKPVVMIGHRVSVDYVMLSGHSPIVVASGYSSFCGNIYCADESLVFVGDTTFTGIGARIDARNGGTVCIDGDALWSTEVTIYTDDMHAIRDAETGKRINEFGSTVVVGRHVWLGQGALLLPGARIGSDSIIGARAVVKKAIPTNAVAAGVPARVIRNGITWSRDDLP
jgi:acetyltransferase-like isoleucine patch superfamily enzyme